MINKPDLSLILYLSSIKLNLSHIELLKYFAEGTQDFLPGKHKLLTELAHQGHIFEGEITERGRSLIKEVETWDGEKEVEVGRKVKVGHSEEFLLWWENFPSSDNFEFAGKEFTGTQSKRTKKEACSTLFEREAALVGAQKLIDALEFEVEARKDESVTRGENQISFMPGTHPYLNQKRYATFLPIIEKRGKYKPKNTPPKPHEIINTNDIF